MNAAEACRNCRFSKTRAPGLMCRRYPPLDTDGRFPAVDPHDWCGEWMGMRPGHGLPVGIAPAPKRPAEASVTHPDREGKGGDHV